MRFGRLQPGCADADRRNGRRHAGRQAARRQLVKFLPDGETQGHGGSAKTNADGHYEITAQRLNRKGLPPGEYKVIVSRLLLPDGSPLPPGARPIETAAAESVPEPFCKPHLTPLVITIGAEAVTFDIPLQK